MTALAPSSESPRRARKRPRESLPVQCLVLGHERAVTPQQPTDRPNGCWIPPVVSIARFYELDSEATIASVLASYPSKDDEDAFEVLERLFGVWAPSNVYGNDASCFETTAEHGVPWCGPTSIEEYGTQRAHPDWFADVRATIDGGDLVLLLVERLEGLRDKGNTHYLLVVGYQEVARRCGNVCSLFVKDPMEGNVVLVAALWDRPETELTTRQASGATLDRYGILESTHMKGLGSRLRVRGLTGRPLPHSDEADRGASASSSMAPMAPHEARSVTAAATATEQAQAP